MLRKFSLGIGLFLTLIVIFSGCNSGNSSVGTEGWIGNPSAVGKSNSTSLAGVVIDQNANPVSGALVSLLISGVPYVSYTTGSSGAFLFLPDPGNYTVQVTKSGFGKFQQAVTITAGVTNTVSAVISSSIGFLSGTVKENSGGLVSGALVQITSITTPTLTYSPITTGASGAYRFTLATGTYSLVVTKTGYASGVASITITRDVETLQDFTLAKTSGGLLGTVTDANGNPQKDVAVRLLYSANSLATQTTTNASSGQYLFNVDAGNYILRASKPGYTYPDTNVTITANATLLKDIQLITQVANVTLQGTVKLLGTNQTLSNISVVNYKGGVILASTTTTATGTFFFFDLTSGQYQLSIGADSTLYEPATYVIQILASGSISPDKPELYLSQKINTTGGLVQAIASGTIYDAVTKAPIEYVNCSVKGIGNTLSDNRGRFEFNNLPVGTYELTVSKNGYTTLVSNFTVTATSTATATSTYLTPTSLTYNLNPAIEEDLGAIEGRFTDPTSTSGNLGLVVKVYTMAWLTQKIEAPGDAAGTPGTQVSWWGFLATVPVEIRTSWTGTPTAGLNKETQGTFRILYLKPNVFFNTNNNLNRWDYSEFKSQETSTVYAGMKYVVYIGKTLAGGIKTKVWNDPRDKAAAPSTSKWYVEDTTTNADRVWSWEVDVKPNTTSYITNVDQPNF